MSRQPSTRSQLPALRAHVERLARESDLALELSETRRSRANYAEDGLVPGIVIRQVKSQVTYLIALHELGHHLAAGARQMPLLDREAACWSWALDESLVEPTRATLIRVRGYLTTYLDEAMRKGMMGEPDAPPYPAPDSMYWEVLGELGHLAGHDQVTGEEERAVRRRLAGRD